MLRLPARLGASLFILLASGGCQTSGFFSGLQTTGPTTTRSTTYVYNVPISAQVDGTPTGGGQLWKCQGTFPQSFISGYLTGFNNSQLPALKIIGPTNKTVTLTAGQSTTPTDIQNLYGQQHPTLPVVVTIIPDVDGSELANWPITVFYTVP